MRFAGESRYSGGCLNGIDEKHHKADIIAAKQAIEYFEQKGIKEIKNIAAYHLQQAAEKLIKYQIYQGLESTDNRRMYTHD